MYNPWWRCYWTHVEKTRLVWKKCVIFKLFVFLAKNSIVPAKQRVKQIIMWTFMQKYTNKQLEKKGNISLNPEQTPQQKHLGSVQSVCWLMIGSGILLIPVETLVILIFHHSLAHPTNRMWVITTMRGPPNIMFVGLSAHLALVITTTNPSCCSYVRQLNAILRPHIVTFWSMG